MAKKRKESVEFRFYEIPRGQAALMLIGDTWDRVYGHENMKYEEEPKLHFHNLMEIGYCKRGEGYMAFDDKKCGYKTGTITIIPENYPHHTISAGEETNYWEYIFFDPKVSITELYPNNPNAQREIVRSINRGPLVLDRDENPSLERLIYSILEEAREERPYSNRMVHFYVDALLTEIMRLNKEMPYYPYEPSKKNTMEQIAKALAYVEEHYMENIKVEDLSKACNMSETHFRRTFEEYINMTPVEYVNLVRIQKACEILKKSGDSMESIAIKCGFATISTFNRNFKKFLGTSPYQWKISPENYNGRLMNYNVSAMKGW